MLAIIGWLALVALCGFASCGWYATLRLILAFGGTRRELVVMGLWAFACAAGWCGVVYIAPFNITIS